MKIIGVIGINGKFIIFVLIGYIFWEIGCNVIVVGNIGDVILV